MRSFMAEAQAVVRTTHKQPNYAAVFWSLFILTVLEITAANMPFAKPLVVVTLVFLAVIKASLVALFYMHLKFEKFIIYLIVIFPLFLAVFLTVMILSDKAALLAP
ncbi:MAG: cytochrome C oxidase subunit IV family protein [Candidatus Omnitrophica bacterium]|nr:cytochrome C oxidase subunit IV family protein [Candidatus Omnitrophota bacterium]